MSLVVLFPQTAPLSHGDTGNCTPRRVDVLHDLPPELQEVVVSHLDEDSQARLGATNRFWRATTQRFVYPEPISRDRAVREGRRHALGRLLRTPNYLAYFSTKDTDDDGMTLLMHAAQMGDAAMLRCLFRYDATEADKTDRSGLTALAWATLSGCAKVFVQASLSNPYACSMGQPTRTQLSLHDAIADGHWHLTQTLLRPHYAPFDPNAAPVARPAYALDAALSCSLLPQACAQAHAPPQRPLVALFKFDAGDTAMSPEELAALGARIDIQSRDWERRLVKLVGLGLDVMTADPTTQRSFLVRWLGGTCADLSSVQNLDRICRGKILGNTPAGRRIFQDCLGFPNYAWTRVDTKPLILALLHRGTLPFDDVNLSARKIVRNYLLDAALWEPLARLGADIHAVDPFGRTLAHCAIFACTTTWYHSREELLTWGYAEADLNDRLQSLIFCKSLGVDVQQRSYDGANPVMDCLWQNARVERNVLPQLQAAGFAFDRPGTVSTAYKFFDADTCFEVALFGQVNALADWFVTNNVACTAQQVKTAQCKFKAAKRQWAMAWLAAHQKTHRLSGLQTLASRRTSLPESARDVPPARLDMHAADPSSEADAKGMHKPRRLWRQLRTALSLRDAPLSSAQTLATAPVADGGMQRAPRESRRVGAQKVA